MATVRDLCRLLSVHVGFDVVPLAAQLRREGSLTPARETADAYDAAHLLLAAMAAREPRDAGVVLDTIGRLQLVAAWRRSGGDWVDAGDFGRSLLPVDPIAGVAEDLDDESHALRITSLSILQDGHVATIIGTRTAGTLSWEVFGVYGSGVAESLMRRSSIVQTPTMTALADLIHAGTPDATTHHSEISIVRH